LRNVAVALGNLKSAEAVPALGGALVDDDPLVRRHVAWALGEIATPEAASRLAARLAAENDTDVREEISRALVRCGLAADAPAVG